MSGADIEDIKARIRTLLSRTPERGCTEAEAVAAAEKALEMMRLHGLTHDAVLITRAEVELRHKRWSDVDALWRTVAATARCRVYTVTNGALRRAVYIGCEPWPEVAGYLHAVVDGSAARAAQDFLRSPEYKRRRAPRTKAAARKAFITGFVAGLATKLIRLVDLSDEVVRRDLKRADDALAAEGPMREVRRSQATAQPRFGDAYSAGVHAGRATNVAFGMRGRAAALALTHEKS